MPRLYNSLLHDGYVFYFNHIKGELQLFRHDHEVQKHVNLGDVSQFYEISDVQNYFRSDGNLKTRVLHLYFGKK